MLDPARTKAILERVRQIPIVDTLRIHIDECDEGSCKATVPRDPRYDGVFESLHGGILMTIADSIACFAIMTQVGPDEPLTTTDMNIGKAAWRSIPRALPDRRHRRREGHQARPNPLSRSRRSI